MTTFVNNRSEKNKILSQRSIILDRTDCCFSLFHVSSLLDGDHISKAP